jgi:hypothetical protein
VGASAIAGVAGFGAGFAGSGRAAGRGTASGRGFGLGGAAGGFRASGDSSPRPRSPLSSATGAMLPERVALSSAPTMSDPNPGPDAAPVEDDRLLDALWGRALEAWTDDKPHGAFIEHCRAARKLGAAAARYRAEADPKTARDPGDEHVAVAKKRLGAILALAMAEMSAARSEGPPPPSTAYKVARGALVLLFLAMVAYSLYRTLSL